jgi:hypothetical protein
MNQKPVISVTLLGQGRVQLSPIPSVVVAYIPDGFSEPQEKVVYAEDGEDLDMLTDRAIEETWDAGDEPFMVIGPSSGVVLWQGSRW